MKKSEIYDLQSSDHIAHYVFQSVGLNLRPGIDVKL